MKNYFKIVQCLCLALLLLPTGGWAAGKTTTTTSTTTTTTKSTTTTTQASTTTSTSTTTTSTIATSAQTCTSVTYPAGASGTAYNITFYFDKAYQCGQFANGDVWVTPYPATTLTITSISPDAVSGLNGFEVNPSSGIKQGLDYRMSGYDATLQPALPLTLTGTVSVVKGASVPVPSPFTSCHSANRPCLQHAAVLTVTAQPVANSAAYFRPGYYGKTKTFTAVNLGGKTLPKLSVTCCSDAANLTFTGMTGRYQRVQLDHLQGWVGRSMHPIDNMPDYGADIARDNAIYLLRTMLSDFDITNATHRQALIDYLQMAVDLKSMAANGVTWLPDGGHSNGRKLPIIFAGWYLGDSSFQASLATSTFSEDKQVYISTRTNVALFGRDCGSADAYWKTTVTGSGTRDCRDPYGLIDGGGKEIGAAYQLCCTAKPWKYTALAIKMLGFQNLWNNSAYMQYVDRWVSYGVVAKPDVCAPYDGVASNYTITYGSPGLTSDCVAGNARWPLMDAASKDAGGYSRLLGDQMWSAWSASNP